MDLRSSAQISGRKWVLLNAARTGTPRLPKDYLETTSSAHQLSGATPFLRISGVSQAYFHHALQIFLALYTASILWAWGCRAFNQML